MNCGERGKKRKFQDVNESRNKQGDIDSRHYLWPGSERSGEEKDFKSYRMNKEYYEMD